MTIIRKQNKIISVLFWLVLFCFSLASLQWAFPCCHFCLLQIIAETFFSLLALRGHGIRLVWKNSAWFYSHCLLWVKRGTKQTPVASVLVRNKLTLGEKHTWFCLLEDDLLIKPLLPFLSSFQNTLSITDALIITVIELSWWWNILKSWLF